MTRPAIYFNNTIRSVFPVYHWDVPSKSWKKSQDAVFGLMGRYGSKAASIGTRPIGKRAPHWVTPTPYSCAFYSGNAESTSGGTFTLVNGGDFMYTGSGVTEFQLTRNPFALYSTRYSVEQELLIKALNKLRSNQVNFGMALATAGETAELLQSTVHRIAKSVRDFRRKRPRDFALAAVNSGRGRGAKVPQAWLELQYAWNPLMADVQGSCAQVEAKARDEGGLFVVKSSKKVSDSYYNEFEHVAGFLKQLGSVSGDCKVKLTYRLRNWFLVELSQLGLTNPLEVVWDRVPYSFVVDWFSPVSNWLSALSGDFGYDFVSGEFAQFYRGRESTVGWRPKDGFINGRPYGGVSATSVSFRRSIYSSSPVPGLYLKSPVSSGHLANAMSLLVQAFRRN